MGDKGGISKDIPDEYHWWDIDWIIFGCKPILVLKYPICLIKWELYAIIMKSIGEIEEKLATKAVEATCIRGFFIFGFWAVKLKKKVLPVSEKVWWCFFIDKLAIKAFGN